MFKALWSVLIGGNPMSWAVLALGATILLGGIFGTGYYMGDTHGARIVADAQVKAVQRATADATKAQAAKDAGDYNKGRTDGLRLGAANQKASSAAKADKAPVVLLKRVVVNGKCPDPVVPKEALHRLNDPALIGDAP